MSIPVVAWFTGLSGAGKTTLARAIQAELYMRALKAEVLDGDHVREGLSRDLGFTREDRAENVRRMSRLAYRLAQEGNIVLVAAIAPEAAIRAEVRAQHESFLEIYVNAPLRVCEQRDVKGLYRKARAGQLQSFTGLSAPYDVPQNPDVECHTDQESIEVSCSKVLQAIEAQSEEMFWRRITA